MDFRFRGKSGHAADISAATELYFAAMQSALIVQ
jgi:hypothetical protein